MAAGARPAAVALLALMLVTGAAAADSVLVLPFANTSSAVSPESANLDWIGESIAEVVREALAARGVPPIERAEISEAYRRLRLRERTELTEASVWKLGEALDANRIVYGTFAFTADAAGAPAETRGSLSVQARVIERNRFRHSPQFGESGELEDLPSLESHLTWQVLMTLAPSQAPVESEFRSLRPPLRLDAQENFIRGLLAPADQKELYFLQATRLDPQFSAAAFELGKINLDRKSYREAGSWLEQVGAANRHYREANFLLGLARFQAADYTGSQAAFQVVADEVPVSEAFNNLGAAASRRDLPQAVDHFRRALEGDPNDPDYHFNLGYALWRKGDFSSAAERFRAVLDRVPGDQMATLLLGRCLQKQGPRKNDPGDARMQALERLKTKYDERAYMQLKSPRSSK
jgi:tetratricopeptide (TPR) repeat protein